MNHYCDCPAKHLAITDKRNGFGSSSALKTLLDVTTGDAYANFLKRAETAHFPGSDQWHPSLW